ncbi:ribosome biogenesis protein BRX1 homolog [Phlebotomus argentipes]|uniref:ribosome biogenesis protein BRX1 homolog n=1 Tax=Phlebotomus argentipes TaxID=94469 RepID=UPI0028936E5F|nr:ribosome biogenesis protein BRX1 homolog [Phlebotomus argentipes]
MGKQKLGKRRRPKVVEVEEKVEEVTVLPETRKSDEPQAKKERWSNRQRVLVMASRGINHRDRHLMRDIKTLMPHHREESKMERTKTLTVVNEMCSMKHCNKAVLFEGRRKMDLYMWVANVSEGPTVKFFVENVHTMGELKMTGNCLRGSRPLLSFDPQFSQLPHLKLLRELLSQVFGVPNFHPKSQPFVDHVYSFTWLDKRIWFRNFQILSEDGALVEIGPRFVLNPVKIFEGSFGGEALWENPDYVSPARYRQMIRKSAGDRYENRMEQKLSREAKRSDATYPADPSNEIYCADPAKKATKIAQQEEESSDSSDEEEEEEDEEEEAEDSSEPEDSE